MSPSPGRLLAAIVLAGAAIGCRQGGAGGTGESSDTGGSSEGGTAGTSTSTGPGDTGAETSTSTGAFTTGPRWDLGPPADAPPPPPPPPPDAYFCCLADDECPPDQVCTTGLWPQTPLEGICTPGECSDPADCPLGEGGNPAPSCVGDPPVCVLGCADDEDCPSMTWCETYDGDPGFCIQCVIPIG
jgi:hypothetical protein